MRDEHQDIAPAASWRVPRIVHVHIAKTAGTSLAEAFRSAYAGRLRFHPVRDNPIYKPAEYPHYDFFGGHVGFKVAREIGGDLITVSRDPVDRFLSAYYYFRQRYQTGEAVNPKTELAAKYDLDQFVRLRDVPILQRDLHNRMLWQLLCGHELAARQAFLDTGVAEHELVSTGLANLRSFSIVGLQSDMPGLADSVRRKYGVGLNIGRANVTRVRRAREEISPAMPRRIESWVELDRELYDRWLLETDGRTFAPGISG